MIECLLIKVSVPVPFNDDEDFCNYLYFQVLREEFYSVESNSIEYYKYYTLFRTFKKRLSRYTANAFLLFLSNIPTISKNDDEYLKHFWGGATIVYKYMIL